jgi:hypothetical protein
MSRYIPAFSWPHSIERFLKEIITEKPILNVCSGDSYFGDAQLERYYFPKDWYLTNGMKVKGDARALPFKDDSFGAIFSDPPWNAGWKVTCGVFCNEALRVAPVLYLMSPWVWGTKRAPMTDAWVRDMRGINIPILITRYARGPSWANLETATNGGKGDVNG